MTRVRNEKLRSALFTLADGRGNNPHGTREDAVSEGRRLNAKRYETVAQMDRALDRRAEQLGAADPQAAASAAGSTTAQELLTLVGAAALGLGLLYILGGGGKEVDEDDEAVLGELGLAPRALPAPAPVHAAPSVVVVVPEVRSAPVTNPVPVVPPPALPAPAPVAVAPPAPEPVKKRRRSK